MLIDYDRKSKYKRMVFMLSSVDVDNVAFAMSDKPPQQHLQRCHAQLRAKLVCCAKHSVV